MQVWTIGFTKRSAAEFFGALRQASIKRLVDIRLHNSSQLAGFTKQQDLPFFLSELCSADYQHQPLLAPTEELLAIGRGGKAWQEYERGFLALMAERKIEAVLDPATFSVPTVLLCSEPTADRCHRRLVLEYLQSTWGGIEIVHL